MSQYDYDLFVIGGGSGGVRAARVAGSLGKRVAIAEEYRFGGTCVIRGCVPKKLFVYASQYHEHFEDAAGYGWTVGESRFDWPSLIAAKDREIDRLEGLYRKGLENAGVEILKTRAELTGPHSVRLLSSGKEVTAERIVVAVGGPPIPCSASWPRALHLVQRSLPPRKAAGVDPDCGRRIHCCRIRQYLPRSRCGDHTDLSRCRDPQPL